MDKLNFDELWNKHAQLDLVASQKFWDLRAEEFNTGMREKDNGRVKALLELLAEKGILHDKAEVLDIGCGPGRYSMLLAQQSKKVVGIDISPEMVRLAAENAQTAGVCNASFLVKPWEHLTIAELGWNKKFDLVFASMCPGINSRETLLKMVQASKGYCFMSGFVYRTEKIKEELLRTIYGQKPDQAWGTSIYSAFNILWQEGFYPEVRYHEGKWEKTWPLDKAIEIFTYQLTRSGFNDAALKEKVADYLNSIADNGFITDCMQAKIALLLWSVD